MNLEERISALIYLGEFLKSTDEYLEALMSRTEFNNAWFTLENQKKAIQAIAEEFLEEEKLRAWINAYQIKDTSSPFKVGLVLAGNIPLVGFHDILCTFVAGHYAVVKPSAKDAYVLPYLIKKLNEFDERSVPYFSLVERLDDINAVIATGSNNSARYFDAYFGKYPNIIRRNRNAVAVLDGSESTDDLRNLGQDIFTYFGLGCRNVSKIFVPENYNLNTLLEVLHENKQLVMHSKYKNNFDYNFAIYSLNKEPFLSNGCLILKEDPALASRISVLHYEYYTDQDQLLVRLEDQKEEIQCVVANTDLPLSSFAFGKAQQPGLSDYADGVDTLQFLSTL